MSMKTATFALLCVIIGCAKGSGPVRSSTAATSTAPAAHPASPVTSGLSDEDLLRKVSPSLSPPAPADVSDDATVSPFGDEPEPDGKRYEYLVDTLYVWTPAQVKEAASSGAPRGLAVRFLPQETQS
jgi:hypothetical protein